MKISGVVGLIPQRRMFAVMVFHEIEPVDADIARLGNDILLAPDYK